MFIILLSNTKEVIKIATVDEIKKILERIAAGDKSIITSGGEFNPSYRIGILYDNKASSDKAYFDSIGYKAKTDSPFAKLLAPKMKMLSDKARTKAQEKASGELRPSGIR